LLAIAPPYSFTAVSPIFPSHSTVSARSAPKIVSTIIAYFDENWCKELAAVLSFFYAMLIFSLQQQVKQLSKIEVNG